MSSPHPLATALITLIEHFQRCDAPTGDQAAIERASQAYARYLRDSDDPWSPISDYSGNGVVIVSRPDDKLYYEPTTAFLDVTGVWRVFRSEGGCEPLPFAPTHFMPTPPRPKAARSPAARREEARADTFLAEVKAELMRGRSLFPGDRIMSIALAEEFGELCKAILDEPAANVRKEAVQTAAMAARIVLDGDSSVAAWRADKGLDRLAPDAVSEGL